MSKKLYNFITMLIDDVTIRITAGKGGDGARTFSKIKMQKGPTGGNGGKGGSIIFVGSSDLSLLDVFRFKKEVFANDGDPGQNGKKDGRNAANVLVRIPVGTIVHNLDYKTKTEITQIGQEYLAANGGNGGKGNFEFRSATNQTPMQAEKGRLGQSFNIRLELKLIADVGFVGLPNVGKSSLLNELTNASAKVANYPFTTLEPNLGVFQELILADIPGLISGASAGKGLGIKFLKHVERTKILFHFIAADAKKPLTDYSTIRKELGKYNKELLTKPEYIFISKSDAVDKKTLDSLIKKFKKKSNIVIPISIYDFDSIQEVKKILYKIQEQKTAS